MVLLLIEKHGLSLVSTESFCLCQLTHVFVVGPVSFLTGSVTVGDAKAHIAVRQLCSIRGELLGCIPRRHARPFLKNGPTAYL
jgi:hypothetical protein